MSNKHIKNVITSGRYVPEKGKFGITFTVIDCEGKEVSLLINNEEVHRNWIKSDRSEHRVGIDLERFDLTHFTLKILVHKGGNPIELKGFEYDVVPESVLASKNIISIGENLKALKRNLDIITHMAFRARMDFNKENPSMRESRVGTKFLEFSTPELEYLFFVRNTRNNGMPLLTMYCTDLNGAQHEVNFRLMGWQVTRDKILNAVAKPSVMKALIDLSKPSGTKSLLRLADDERYKETLRETLLTVTRHEK
ncbi:hypothetical protein HWC35_gp007 [Vibrio phage USC-1]|uniref:Uncharacterized protein n=2 Tax=Aphroditevirus USC1 TaxID=2846605 RepID=A0A514A2B0_9CAUD|nr:hypothetical protein HWC35_gp007 [Vibrio phage USC-1]QCW23115.1 hypothetical protein [Vibrio phage 5 TSL-2019]QDH47401.1 hypothetical protein [Vibrio phage USC-1]